MAIRIELRRMAVFSNELASETGLFDAKQGGQNN